MLLASLNPAAVAAGADIGDAVRIDGTVLSRSDLVGAATSVAERVAGAQRVAVLATPTATTVLAITGCLIAGVPVVPVPADVGAAERRHIVTDSGAQAWLGEKPPDTDGLPHIPVRLHARSWHRYAEPPPDATALIIYTSGTTGPPKGVVVSRRRDRRRHRRARGGLAVDARGHPGARPAAVSRARAGAGAARVAARRKSLRAHRKTDARRVCGGRWFAVLRGADGVVDGSSATAAAAKALASARLLVSGSAPLPVPVFDKLAELTGHRPVERYGATESLITISTRADGERRPGWVGLPLTGIETRLVDEDGAAVAHDGETIGRLQVRGPTMFDGYLNRPGRHRRGVRRRRLVPHRRCRGDRRRRACIESSAASRST